MDRSACIFVAGHRTMAGNALERQLRLGDYIDIDIDIDSLSRAELGLFDQCNVHDFLEQEKPNCAFIAAGVQHNVRQFIDMAAREPGITIAFSGNGDVEIGPVVRVEGALQAGRADWAYGPALVPADQGQDAARPPQHGQAGLGAQDHAPRTGERDGRAGLQRRAARRPGQAGGVPGP